MDRVVDELPAGPNKSYLDSLDFGSDVPPIRFIDEIKVVCGSLKLDSSPGLPFGYHYDTIGDVLLAVGETYIAQLAWGRLQRLALGKTEGLTPEQLVAEGFTGPVRYFVKSELHTQLKVEQGRMRLIAVLDLVDQVIERWLHGGQNRANINTWETIPCKPGMGLHDEGLLSLQRSISDLGDLVAGTDVSGFDFWVPMWALQADASVRIALAGCGPASAYATIVRNRVTCLGNSLMVLSDGSVFSQRSPGIQKSGSYNTSSTNSCIRLMMAYMAGAEKAITQGDDCAEAPSATAAAFYERHMPVKSYDVSECPEFCSFGFRLGGGAGTLRVVNARGARQLASLLNKAPLTYEHEEELVSAILHNFRHGVLGLEGADGQPHEVTRGEVALRECLARWGWGYRVKK